MSGGHNDLINQVRHDRRSITYHFDRFTLDPTDRRLLADGAPVELNARYFDALALLVREAGTLVTKDRFMAEIWGGIPVTDEALTQCIRTLRKRLGDDAARPRFIETAPKHGYRFVAPVVTGAPPGAGSSSGEPTPGRFWRSFFATGLAGTLGGAAAGIAGGVLYGFLGASQPGAGALSVLLVMTSIALLVATLGAAGVGFGIAAVRNLRPWWQVGGGALGGLLVGTAVSLLARDALVLLVGDAPAQTTGAAEGILLGAAAGLAAWLGGATGPSIRRGAVAGAAVGGAAGLLVAMLGGKLLAGSLALLAASFPDSRLRIEGVGKLLGEDGFGPLSEAVTGSLEGALFCACVAGAIVATRKLRA